MIVSPSVYNTWNQLVRNCTIITSPSVYNTWHPLVRYCIIITSPGVYNTLYQLVRYCIIISPSVYNTLHPLANRALPYSAICLSIYDICTVLLWSTDAKSTHPFKPRQRRPFKSCVVAILLLLNVNVESNTGPAPEALRIGHINPWSCVNKTKFTLNLLNAIVEQRIDVLAIAESFIKDQDTGHIPFQS